MIKTEIFSVTPLKTNCVYVEDEASGCSAVFDPGDKSPELIKKIKSGAGKLDYVLLTHGHYDHIAYAKQLADMFSAEIVTGRLSAEFLKNPLLNLCVSQGFLIEPFDADILLDDGDTFMLGETEIKYISTPGHTMGCGSYIFDNTIVCGDTLFRASCGRTDLPTGNMSALMTSLKKLRDLSGDYNIIPGHGPLTTLEFERKYNPYMNVL